MIDLEQALLRERIYHCLCGGSNRAARHNKVVMEADFYVKTPEITSEGNPSLISPLLMFEEMPA